MVVAVVRCSCASARRALPPRPRQTLPALAGRAGSSVRLTAAYTSNSSTCETPRDSLRINFSNVLSQRHSQDALEVIAIEWFVHVGDCSKFQGLAGPFGVGISRHHDHSDGGVDRTDALEHFKAARAAGQP